MKISTALLATAATIGLSALAGEAAAAQYAVLDLHIDVNQPVDVVWKKVGGYCDIGAWLKVSCAYTSGTGDVGTVRRLSIPRLPNPVDEVLVGKTAHSYTYTQPNTTILYHGTLEVVPDGAGHSKILYNLIWDQAPLPSDDAKAKDREQRTRIFTTALETMKSIAESP